tara:strand:+ start:122 stop:5107 length:4986 start_codon:yes stop_codon:yes gene_type:complete
MDLTSANFTNADLSGTNLSDANLSGAIFENTNLTNANIFGANVTNSHFGAPQQGGPPLLLSTFTNLTSGSLIGNTHLISGVVQPIVVNGFLIAPGADITGANLSGADFTSFDLDNVNLTNADLTNTDLSGANLRFADLSGADLSGADLTNTDLTGATILGSQLNNSITVGTIGIKAPDISSANVDSSSSIVSVGNTLSVNVVFSEKVKVSSVNDTTITLNDGTILDLSSGAHTTNTFYDSLTFEKFLDPSLVSSKRNIQVKTLNLTNSATIKDDGLNNFVPQTNTDIDILKKGTTTPMNILNKVLFLSSTLSADDNRRDISSSTNFLVTHNDVIDVSFAVWPNLKNPVSGPGTIKLMNGLTILDTIDLSAGTLSLNDTTWTGTFNIPSSGVSQGQTISLNIDNLENNINSQKTDLSGVSNFQKTIQIDTNFGTIIDISGQDTGWESELDISSNNQLNPLTRAKEGNTVTAILKFTEKVPEPEFNFRSGTTVITQNRLTYATTGGNITNDTDFGIEYSDKWTISYITNSSDTSGVISWYVNSQDIAGNELRSPSSGYQDTSILYDKTGPTITSIIANSVNPAVPKNRLKNGNRIDISLNINEADGISQATGSKPAIKWGIFTDLSGAKAAGDASWNNLQQGNLPGSAVSVVSLVGTDDTSWEVTTPTQARYWPGDGDLYFRTSITDLANNNLVDIRRATGTDGDLVIDNTNPTLEFVDISTNNPVDSNRATNGDTLTLSFKTDNGEALALHPTTNNSMRFPLVRFYLGGGSFVTSTFNNAIGSPVMLSTTDDINFTATHDISGNTGQNAGSNDAISYQIITSNGANSVKDTAMNNVTGISLTASSVLMDTTPASVDPSSITIVSDNSKNNLATNGDTITLTFTTDISLNSADVTIDGSAASVTLATSSPWTHTATHTLPLTRASTTGELCNFDISGIIDTANNKQSTNYTRASTQTARNNAGNKNVTIDNSGQLITLTSFVKTNGDKFDNTKIRSGENARLTFSLPSVTVTDGSNAEFLSSNTVTFYDSANNQLGTSSASLDSGNTYIANFTIPTHNPPATSVIDGTIQYSIDASDNVGNDITFSKTSFGSLDIDNTAPVISASNITILSLDNHTGSANQPIQDPSNAKVGDTVRLTFVSNESLKDGTASGASDNSKNSITVTSGGANITNTPTISYLTTSKTNDTIRVEYDVSSNDTDGDISFNLTYYDLAGNESSAIRGTTFSMPTVVTDTTAPTLVSLDISSNRTNKLDPSRNAATDHTENGDIITIEFEITESIHAPVVTIFPNTPGVTPINITAIDISGNTGQKWRVRNTMHHSQPTGNIPFRIQTMYDLAGNTLASLDNSNITTGNSVKHYFGMVTIIPKGGTIVFESQFLDIYKEKLSGSINPSNPLTLDKGVLSAYDPIFGDVTSQVTTHDITSGRNGSITIEYRYTDSYGRVFKTQRRISIGDPYIIPAFGEIYKLPNLNKIYRLFQYKSIYVNASVKKATKEKESQILDYYENLGGNKNTNQEIITDGYYYDKFFIKSNNNYILIDIINNSISYSKNAKEYFNIEVIENVNNLNSFYAGEAVKLNIKFDNADENLGFSIILFKNPQIDNGIEILNEVSKDAIGLLVRNYKSNLFEIDNIENTKNINLENQKNNLIKNNIVFEEEEIFENLKE